MIRKLFLAVSVAILGARFAFSDQVAATKFTGLNDQSNSVVISPSEAQDLLNVDVTPTGASIKKRSGFGVYKALGTGKAVHGGYHAFDSTGNDYQLWGSSTSLYGIVADGTPIQLVSSATINSTWDCTDTQGSSYCVDSSRDLYLQTNGTTKTWFTTPLGTMVESTPDRVVVAGVSGSVNTLYVSQSNTFTNFTVGANTTDAFTEVIASPGSKLTHIRWGCGKLLWWKDQSFGYFDFDNQFVAQVKTVSDTIGTFDNTSAIDPGGRVWFRGQDGHTWMYDCSVLSKQSIDITPNVQASGKRVSNFWNQTSQSDWQAGVSTPAVNFNLSVSVGDVSLSSFSAVDTSSTDFVQGTYSSTIDTFSATNSISLKNYADTFSDLSKWGYVIGSSGFSTAGGFLSQTNNGDQRVIERTDVKTISNDNRLYFEFRENSTLKASNTIVYYIDNVADTGYGIGIYSTSSSSPFGIDLERVNSFSGTLGPQLTQLGFYTLTRDTAWHTFRLSRDSSGNMTVYIDGTSRITATDNTYTNFNTLGIYGITNTALGSENIDNLYWGSLSGNFTSRTLNTSLSTNIAMLQANWTVNTSTPYIEMQTSTNGSAWTKVTSSTGTSQTTNQYLRYVSSFSVALTEFPSTTLDDVTIVAKSTGGVFASQVKNASNLSAWSTFVPSIQTAGGSETFYMRSSTYGFTTSSATPAWTAQAVGGLVSVATGTYFQVRDDFTSTSATSTLALNDFTVNWFEGSASDQAYMLYFDNAIWESVASGAGQSINNYIFKYDLINQGWTLYSFGAGGMLIEANTLYFGDTSTTGANVFNFGTATSDNGSAIQAFWRSKSYTGADPFLQTALTNIDIFAKKDTGTTLTATYTTDTSTATAYTVSLSTTNSIVQSRKLLPAGKQGYVWDLKLGDTSTSSAWEILGYRIGFNQLPYRPQN